jgi:uncharacterized BrkB/YihY/UPF0761 family membrane protein
MKKFRRVVKHNEFRRDFYEFITVFAYVFFSMIYIFAMTNMVDILKAYIVFGFFALIFFLIIEYIASIEVFYEEIK